MAHMHSGKGPVHVYVKSEYLYVKFVYDTEARRTAVAKPGSYTRPVRAALKETGQLAAKIAGWPAPLISNLYFIALTLELETIIVNNVTNVLAHYTNSFIIL